MMQSLAFSIFPLLAIASGVFDFLTLRIPNWLNGLTALAFVFAALVFAMPLPLAGLHLAAGFALLVLGFGLFAANLIGGGDAKMLAAAGLWIGFEHIVPFLIYTTIAGGVLAIAVLAFRKAQAYAQMTGMDAFASIAAKKIDLPYGMAIAAGALLVLPETWWFAALQP
jgi:prepilin peptidase CpaA